jgi:hypothetical protein
MRPNKFPAQYSRLFLLRLIVAINIKMQQRECVTLLQCLCLTTLQHCRRRLCPPAIRTPRLGTSRHRNAPLEATRHRQNARVWSLATETPVPEPPVTRTSDRYFVVGVHWRRNPDMRTPTKMSLLSAFFRWCSDGNKRRRQYADNRYFVAMNADDQHATKFPSPTNGPGANKCFCCVLS